MNILSLYLPGTTKDNMETSVRIAGILSEIQKLSTSKNNSESLPLHSTTLVVQNALLAGKKKQKHVLDDPLWSSGQGSCL
jgi:hypothetical protein